MASSDIFWTPTTPVVDPTNYLRGFVPIRIQGGSSDGSADAFAQIPIAAALAATSIVATEALAAGAFVNVYGAAGASSVRNASAADPTRFANGFVINAVASGSAAVVQFMGFNTAPVISGPASEVWLSDVALGGFATTAPSVAGHIIQPLGVAMPSVGIFFFPRERVQI